MNVLVDGGWEEKVWGKVWHLFSSDQAAVSFLHVNKGFRCSKHLHRERVNQFAVISGRIIVERWVSGEFSQQELGPGETAVVGSMVLHRFRVIESGDVVEVYWPGAQGSAVRLDDIEREDEGGRDE